MINVKPPEALDGISLSRLFVSGLFTKRLRVRVSTAIGPDCDKFEEAVKSSFVELAAVNRSLEEGRLVQKQIDYEKRSSNKPPTKPSKRRFSEKGQPHNKQNGKRFGGGEARRKQSTEPKKPLKFSKGIICRICKKEGHYSYQCPNKESKSSDEYLVEIKSTTTSRDFGLRSFVKIKDKVVGDVSCLPDTGADRSVISSSLVTDLGAQVKTSMVKSISLADGSSTKVLGEVEIHLRIPGYDGCSLSFNENCLVIDMVNDGQHQVLIGKDTVLKQKLLEWDQPAKRLKHSELEKELNTEFVEFFPDMDGKWSCDIPELKRSIAELLAKYKEKINVMKPAKVEKFSMKLIREHYPPTCKARRISFHIEGEVRHIIEDLRDKGFITPSKSPFAAPLVIDRKPSGKLRLCCGYVRLNKITIDDEYPLPRQDTLFSALEGQTIFAALDLRNGYYHIEVEEATKKMTAFITPFGLFQWNRMPFGLKTAPAHFQRCINEVLKDLIT
ncbi:hypothetical protein ADUPG1_010530 [Aduncisulcus paluster]|uniref:CCHC-type domain-containing protein n=1 Tax=Aduncisulcus paluster TaxID=2918883 RepID=A0ABQ5JRR4_9EUKA|nr:hypothetical protein ADUPG1_010530 [Aduncisulcus paluster]